MRNTTIATIIIVALILNLNCLKEATEPQMVKADNVTWVTAEDAELLKGWSNRDGAKWPFDFRVSQVVYDLFGPERRQRVFNVRLVDSTVYTRVDAIQYGFAGAIWNKYSAVKHYSSGDTVMYKAFAVAGGPVYTWYPNVAYNQLSVGNNHKWLVLEVQPRPETYFDHFCGVSKKRSLMRIITPDGDEYVNTIDPSSCAGNAWVYDRVY